MRKRDVSPLTLRDIWDKLEQIDGKIDEQKKSQIIIYLTNFGITYVVLGFSLMATVMVAILFDIFAAMIMGIGAICIGSFFIIFSDRLYDRLQKKKTKKSSCQPLTR